MRWSGVVKLIRAVELIGRPQGASIKDLQEHLEMDRVSVHRFLKTMEDELNFPIYNDTDSSNSSVRKKFNEHFIVKLPNISVPSLTFSDLIALLLVKNSTAIFKGSEIGKEVDNVFDKLKAFLPSGMAKTLARVQDIFLAADNFVKDYSGKEQIIDSLVKGILQQKICLVKYHSFSDDTSKRFRIDPLHFFARDGGLYLIGNVTKYANVRFFAVERFSSVEITDENYRYPENFDPKELLETSFNFVSDDPVLAKIWFSERQAKYIKERKWSKDQTIMEQPDGSIILALHTSGQWDIIKWVTTFGPEAEILGPPKLRKDFIDNLKLTFERYAAGRDPELCSL